MPQNTSPIFTQTPRLGFGIINSVNNTFDMTTGTSSSLFVAGSSGSYVSKIRVKPSGSTAATVLRFFLNSGSTTTSTNNSLYAELSMPAITTSSVLAQNDFEVPMNIAIPASYVIYGVSATAPGAGTGFEVTTIGGDY